MKKKDKMNNFESQMHLINAIYIEMRSIDRREQFMLAICAICASKLLNQ